MQLLGRNMLLQIDGAPAPKRMRPEQRMVVTNNASGDIVWCDHCESPVISEGCGNRITVLPVSDAESQS